MNILIYLVLAIAVCCVCFKNDLNLTNHHLIIIATIATLFAILFANNCGQHEGFAIFKTKIPAKASKA
jgi:peptidoglycan/LPS O-acetylase OafA/YrhL